MQIGVVTGASSGMGMEFALQLEQRYELDEIWLIARRKERLEELQGRLTRVRTVILPMDLTSQADMQSLVERIASMRPDIKVLVNNAGYGVFGEFDEQPLQPQLGMIDLNIKASVELTYHCLPYMHSGSLIVQIGSLFGLMPGVGGWAIYAASKACISSFAAALRQELKPRGIHVIAVNPGGVRTEFGDVAGKTGYDIPSGGSEPAVVVRHALDDAARGAVYSIHGLIPRLMVLLARIAPAPIMLRMLYLKDTRSFQIARYYENRRPWLMKNLDKLLKPVRQVLATRYGEDFADRIIAETRTEYANLIPAFPYVGGNNMRMMTNKIIWSAHCLALYRVMQRHGKSVDEIGTLIGEAVERSYASFPKNIIARISGPFIFTPIVTGPLRREAARSQKGNYPLGGVMQFIRGDGIDFDFGLDFLECPIQKFFHAQGADGLTPYICQTDFIASRACRSGIKRTTTLADGGTKCDSRWKRGAAVKEGTMPERG